MVLIRDPIVTVTTQVPDVLIDATLDEIRRKMQVRGYAQFLIPPSESRFTEKIMGITWRGTLILTDGRLTGLDTLRRIHDSALSVSKYAHNEAGKRIVEVTFNVDLGLTNLATTSDFYVILTNHRELSGVATGSLKEVILTITIALNVLTRRMRLTKLKFGKLGKVSTEITGFGGILNFLASKVTKMLVNRRTKSDMVSRLEQTMKDIFAELVDDTKWPLPGTQWDLDLLIDGLQSAFEEKRVIGDDEKGGGAGGTEVGPSILKQNGNDMLK